MKQQPAWSAVRAMTVCIKQKWVSWCLPGTRSTGCELGNSGEFQVAAQVQAYLLMEGSYSFSIKYLNTIYKPNSNLKAPLQKPCADHTHARI